MTLDNRTGLEAVLAIASIAIGVAGAALVEPVILGVAATGAVIATVLKLSDKSRNSNPYGAPERKKARIA